ncbi:MAG: bifunctional chorismate mutase/prephenate dehydratase [Erysipelotrichaceae bacterium]|nr:bifunctional chorismate mutase/prephenate dehydratase [Erysipelotrichaceae bacterium]
MSIKVGYQGANGTFSEIAVNNYFKEKDFIGINYTNFVSIVKDVQDKVIDYALLPVENTTTGIISRTYDLFKDYDIFAVGEINVLIEENLIVLKDTKLEDIKEVYSHPEVIGQCSIFFNDNLNIRPIPYQDTAKSVEYIKSQNNKSKAALASSLAAKYYELDILLRNVQDNKNNVTRFLCVSNNKNIDKDANKISTMFIIKHEAGSLFRLLEVFAKENINLLKLESRPIQGKHFEYCFYLDFDGNINDKNVKKALEKAKNHSIYQKVLGCYKKAII